MERSTFIPDKFISPTRETMCYKCKLILACNYYKLITLHIPIYGYRQFNFF